MTKLDFHHFQVRHFNNVFEQSWCHCRVGATPASRSNCLQTRRIHHQVKYRRLNANTCIVAAILFSGHPYIGRHYRASLIEARVFHFPLSNLYSVLKSVVSGLRLFHGFHDATDIEPSHYALVFYMASSRVSIPRRSLGLGL